METIYKINPSARDPKNVHDAAASAAANASTPVTWRGFWCLVALGYLDAPPALADGRWLGAHYIVMVRIGNLGKHRGLALFGTHRGSGGAW